MQTWFLFIIFSILVVSIGEIAQKLSVTSKNKLQVETINFFLSCTQIFLSGCYLIFFGGEFEWRLKTIQIFTLVIGSVLSYYFFKFLYGSYKGNSVSISQIIFSFSVVISTIFGIIYFEESKSWIKFIGIFLILCAVIAVNFQKGEKLSKYNVYALVAAFMYGLLATLDKLFSTTINVHYYQLLASIGFAITSLILGNKRVVNDFSKIERSNINTILISAISFTIFNKLTFLAYSKGGEVGKVDAINNTAIFLIIIFEVFILKDRKNLMLKITTAFLAIIGIFILGFL